MPGVIVLLDHEHHQKVEQIWDTMEREFGVPRGYPGALPHFTLHLAAAYDPVPTARAVSALAAAQAPFEVRTTGFGMFSGDAPVIHLQVVRGPSLGELHRALWTSLAGHTRDPVPYYSPDRWMPHITLGYSNIASALYPALLPWLAAQNLSWEFTATTLALGEDTPSGMNLTATFPLLG